MTSQAGPCVVGMEGANDLPVCPITSKLSGHVSQKDGVSDGSRSGPEDGRGVRRGRAFPWSLGGCPERGLAGPSILDMEGSKGNGGKVYLEQNHHMCTGGRMRSWFKEIFGDRAGLA